MQETFSWCSELNVLCGVGLVVSEGFYHYHCSIQYLLNLADFHLVLVQKQPLVGKMTSMLLCVLYICTVFFYIEHSFIQRHFLCVYSNWNMDLGQDLGVCSIAHKTAVNTMRQKLETIRW